VQHELLRNVLLEASQVSHPVTVELVSGPQLVVRISTVGKDWLSGEVEAGQARGVIIPFRSLEAVWARESVANTMEEKPVGQACMRMALVNLVSLRKQVRVHTLRHRWNGVLTGAFQDYVVIVGNTGDPVCLPYAAVNFVEVF
jgi:hypothetical protein